MTPKSESAVTWDPYRAEFWMDPYPVFRRLREEAPLYRNEEYGFYAVSRFADVEQGFINKETFSSSRGDVLEYIKADMDIPSGMFIWEDPPLHTVHRGVLTRVFTPKRMNDLEEKIRAYCARCLDPLVGAGRFDFITDFGAEMPMRVIGMLLGIPEEGQVDPGEGRRVIADRSRQAHGGLSSELQGARIRGVRGLARQESLR